MAGKPKSKAKKAQKMPFIVLQMRDGKQLVTFNLKMPKVKHLRGELIAGEIDVGKPGEKMDFRTFKRNTTFIEFYKGYRNAVQPPELKKEAKRIGNGSVLVFDRRMKDLSSDVPPCEIIGAYPVKDGKIFGPFVYNPHHKILCPEHGASIMFGELQKTAEKIAYAK